MSIKKSKYERRMRKHNPEWGKDNKPDSKPESNHSGLPNTGTNLTTADRFGKSRLERTPMPMYRYTLPSIKTQPIPDYLKDWIDKLVE